MIQAFIAQLMAEALESNIQRLSVAAALVEQQKVLVLKRKNNDFLPGLYELPGGTVEKGESIIQTLHRELKEETNCKPKRVLGYIGSFDYPSSRNVATRRFNFLVEPSEPWQLKLTEHETHAWIYPHEREQYHISSETRRIISYLESDTITYFDDSSN